MRRVVHPCSAITVAVVCVALLPPAARAQGTAAPAQPSETDRAAQAAPEARREARVLTESAEADYREGRFESAAVGYERAYELVPAPQLLFNIGQCQRKLGRPARAKTFFEAYLRARPDAPQRIVVEQLIAEADAQLREHEAISAHRAASRAPPSSGAPRVVTAPSPVDDEQPLLVERWWFWAGVGVVTAGGVVATLLLTRDLEDDSPATTLGTIRWR